MKTIHICKFCNNSTYNKSFCSFACKGNWQKENLKGSNNPNFNNNFSDEYRRKRSELSKKQMEDPEMRFKAGSANRGKKFSKERCLKQGQGHIGICHPHTNETKIKIGIKSAQKFTIEYKRLQRIKNYKSGQWINPMYKDEYKLYREFSNWKYKMFDIIEDGVELLKQLKVFNAKTNRNGVVRDHKYGRINGFNNKVFPEILRHPVNCQLITAADNIRKRMTKTILYDSIITLNELFNLIINFKGIWDEHELCITLIEKYKNPFL